jgi:hypothetical protein
VGSGRDTRSNAQAVKFRYKYNEYPHCKVEHTRRACYLGKVGSLYRQSCFVDPGEDPSRNPSWG